MGVPAPLGVAAFGLPPAGDQATAYLSGLFLGVGPGDPFAFRGPMNFEIWASALPTLTTTNGSLAASVGTASGQAAGGALNSINVPRGTTWATFSGTAGTLALPAVTLPASNLSVSSTFVTLPPGSNVASLLGAAVTTSTSRTSVTLAANTTVAAIIQLDVAPSLNSPGTPGIIQLSAAPTAIGVMSGTRHLRFQLTSAAITTGVDALAVATGATITYVGSVQIERSFDGGATWLVCNVGSGGTLAQFSAGTPISLVFGEPEKNVLYRANCTAYTSGLINYRVSQTGGANESLAVGPLSGG